MVPVVVGNGFGSVASLMPSPAGLTHQSISARMISHSTPKQHSRALLPTQILDEHEHEQEQCIGLETSGIYVADKNGLHRSHTWEPVHAGCHQQRTPTRISQNYVSARRRFSLQLPPFSSLGIVALTHIPKQDMKDQLYIDSQQSLETALCGSELPLTPPPEDVLGLDFENYSIVAQPGDALSSSSKFEQSEQELQSMPDTIVPRVQGIAMSESSAISTSSQPSRSPCIMNASHKILASLSSQTELEGIHVVSHTLPSQPKENSARPTFEEIVDRLQTELEAPPYITITHAVPQAMAMEEVPKTPPSTPSLRHESNDYFGHDDQTIFTNAAVVPIYHTHEHVESGLHEHPIRQIAAPGSTQISILERYIPPTMSQEIDDFFSTSSRSYLTDRLHELSPKNGSLLLVYPTRKGGHTFARQYIGPMIEPHLRRFIMLNGLTSAAAALMGRMTAIEKMIDIDEMKKRIDGVCENLNARALGRGPKSAFRIVHSETANVVLERKTWINWFVEQEQSRLRQNLVEYHQSGGRMPQTESFREVTVSMLTRDFIEGLQKSQEPAGDEDIEVAVFVITRSKISDPTK